MSAVEDTTDTASVAREMTAFQRNVLVVLAEEPMYGLAIKRELEDYYGTDVNHGRLYPNLDELIELGFVEKSQLDKRTNQYSLTDDGYEAILDQLRWMIGRVTTDESRAEELRELVTDPS